MNQPNKSRSAILKIDAAIDVVTNLIEIGVDGSDIEDSLDVLHALTALFRQKSKIQLELEKLLEAA